MPTKLQDQETEIYVAMAKLVARYITKKVISYK